MLKCHFCEKEKEVGKELFWCPRLCSYNNSLNYHGSWVCLNCCKDSFFKNSYDKHLSGSWIGSCAECDFPVGAILDANNRYEYPEELDLSVRKRKFGQEEKFVIEPLNFFNRYYYNFKWDNNIKGLKLTKRIRDSFNYLTTLVLEQKKLPTRIIIVLEDTFTYEPLSWYELSRYYWRSIGSKQHFREEKWMDQAPVIICSGYLDGKRLCLEKKFKKKIANLNKIIFNQIKEIAYQGKLLQEQSDPD